MNFGASLLALVLASPATPPDTPVARPHAGSHAWAPGGYWGAGEWHMPRPDDGEELLIAGAIVLPVGVLTTASGSVMAYYLDPRRCPGVLSRIDLSAEECRGLFGVGLARIAYGGLMVLSGVVMLSIGAKRKHRFEIWKRQYGFHLTPAWDGKMGSVRFGFRF